jgi:tetratricopeptide (TPR) repeat protein
MNQRTFFVGSILTLSTLLLLSFTGAAVAADCLAIRKKIKQETDLLKRREMISQGLTNCPNDPVINFKYAYSLERFRKYDEALKHYQVATKLDPKYAKAYFGMGDMYIQKGDPQASVAAYQKGLAIDPGDKRAARSLQKALAKAKTMPATVKTVKAPQKHAAVSQKKTTTGAVKKPVAKSTTMMPYNPSSKTIFQTPQNQLPVAGAPLGKESLQTFTFNKAGHSDATGSLDDNLMGAN